MADRSNQRLNEAIENMIRMWDGHDPRANDPEHVRKWFRL